MNQPPICGCRQPSHGRLWFLKYIAGLLLFAASMAPAFAQIQTTVSFTLSPNPIVAGQPVKITITITPAQPSSNTPQGTLTVQAGATQVCFLTLPANSCSFTINSAGSVNISVLYSSSDNNFAGNFVSKTTSVVSPTTTILTSNANPSSAGQNVIFTATVNGTALTGTVQFRDGGSTLCGSVALSAGKAVCGTSTLSVGQHAITAAYSGDSSNGASTSAALNQSVQQPYVQLNQFGLTGAWYNPATTGQGFFLLVYPDLVAAGTALFAGSWFTYDTTSGGADRQRWYSFSGSARDTDTLAQLDLFSTVGGNFNAGPKVVAARVGQVAVQFTGCNGGLLNYSFNDGRSGQIPLTRLTGNVTCGVSRDNGTPGGIYLLSGAWYDPNTSGQGLIVDIDPASSYFAAAWYTFSPNGQATGGGASQRWYTLQAPLTSGSKTIANIDVYTRTGGVFDNAAAPSPPTKVGSATFEFLDCNTASLTFNFSAGSSAGQTGSINLQRVGPAPSGCSL